MQLNLFIKSSRTRGISASGTSRPGQPNHLKFFDFLRPESADTRPPEDIAYWYVPSGERLIVTGRRLDITRTLLLFVEEEGPGSESAGAAATLGITVDGDARSRSGCIFFFLGLMISGKPE